MLSDVINLGNRIESLDVSPQFEPYSKVVINISDDTFVSAGNDTGRVLEMDNPFGTKELAQEILNKLSGYRYQPYEAEGSLLDPAAEIGDAVNTPSSYGGIYTRKRTFGSLMKADISAPHDEEINREYKFETPTERKFKREVGDLRASLIITNNMIQSEVTERKAADNALNGSMDEMSSRITQTADAITAEVSRATAAEGTLSSSLSIQASEIAAKVSSSGGGSSFSWAMDSSSHTWRANNQEVMSINASGLTVKGVITATGGKIGGFDIGSTALQYNGLNWGDTTKNYGAYIGQSGIQLGKNFKVDNAGNLTASNLTATNLTLSGTLNMGGVSITPQDLANRANSAYRSTSSGGYCFGGASAGYSYNKATVSGTSEYPSYFKAGAITATSSIVSLGNMQVSGTAIFSTIQYSGYTMRLRAVKASDDSIVYALCR